MYRIDNNTTGIKISLTRLHLVKVKSPSSYLWLDKHLPIIYEPFSTHTVVVSNTRRRNLVRKAHSICFDWMVTSQDFLLDHYFLTGFSHYHYFQIIIFSLVIFSQAKVYRIDNNTTGIKISLTRLHLVKVKSPSSYLWLDKHLPIIYEPFSTHTVVVSNTRRRNLVRKAHSICFDWMVTSQDFLLDHYFLTGFFVVVFHFRIPTVRRYIQHLSVATLWEWV